jgi:hypothetical protein
MGLPHRMFGMIKPEVRDDEGSLGFNPSSKTDTLFSNICWGILCIFFETRGQENSQ